MCPPLVSVVVVRISKDVLRLIPAPTIYLSPFGLAPQAQGSHERSSFSEGPVFPILSGNCTRT